MGHRRAVDVYVATMCPTRNDAARWGALLPSMHAPVAVGAGRAATHEAGLDAGDPADKGESLRCCRPRAPCGGAVGLHAVPVRGWCPRRASCPDAVCFHALARGA